MEKIFDNFGLNSDFCSFEKVTFSPNELREIKKIATYATKSLDSDLLEEQLKLIIINKLEKWPHKFNESKKEIVIDKCINTNNLSRGFCHITNRILKVTHFKFLNACVKRIIKSLKYKPKVTFENCVMVLMNSKTYSNKGLLINEQEYLCERKNNFLKAIDIPYGFFQLVGDFAIKENYLYKDTVTHFFKKEEFSQSTEIRNLFLVIPALLELIENFYLNEYFKIDDKHLWNYIEDYFYTQRNINRKVYIPSPYAISEWISNYYKITREEAKILYSKIAKGIKHENTLYWLLSSLYFYYFDEFNDQEFVKFLKSNFIYSFTFEFKHLSNYKIAKMFFMIHKLYFFYSNEQSE
ncbi:hypothetical protein [Mycoplasma crocodyli]|uniref:hypothetical protein n=1 Tax=Mycoplasma crocodyli TaxID=50052 RepID=UPI0002EFC72D|nr:hypothetical protein [Mycoplasma crocodyli]